MTGQELARRAEAQHLLTPRQAKDLNELLRELHRARQREREAMAGLRGRLAVYAREFLEDTGWFRVRQDYGSPIDTDRAAARVWEWWDTYAPRDWEDRS